MNTILGGAAFTVAVCASFAAAPCSVDFILTKQGHSIDEWGRAMMTAELRNDNDAECVAQVHYVVTDKAGYPMYTQDRWYGGFSTRATLSPRSFMVGESRKISEMLPKQLVKQSKDFSITVTDAKHEQRPIGRTGRQGYVQRPVEAGGSAASFPRRASMSRSDTAGSGRALVDLDRQGYWRSA